MKRLMAFAVVALFAFSAVGAAGCATGVEDPQPPPPTPTKSNPPPATPFAAEDIDTSKPDPTVIGNGGLDAPKPQLEQIAPPVPVNGTDDINTNLESDNPDWDPTQLQAPIAVTQ
jgi:hypothetical protein